MAGKPQQSTQSGKDNELILYRLTSVEEGVKTLNTKFDRQDTIKSADLKNFQETIVTRFLDMTSNLQKQIDQKASQTELQDLKRLVYSAFGFLSTIIGALVIAYFTTRG